MATSPVAGCLLIPDRAGLPPTSISRVRPRFTATTYALPMSGTVADVVSPGRTRISAGTVACCDHTFRINQPILIGIGNTCPTGQYGRAVRSRGDHDFGRTRGPNLASGSGTVRPGALRRRAAGPGGVRPARGRQRATARPVWARGPAVRPVR